MKYKNIPIIISKSRTGYNAYSPIVDGCIAVHKTIDITVKMMKEALELHLSAGGEITKKIKSRAGLEKLLIKELRYPCENIIVTTLRIPTK